MINQILSRLNLWISHIFPRDFTLFLKKKYGNQLLIGCEIGVYKGENAEWFFKTLNIIELYLIDSYYLYGDYDDGKLHYGIDQDNLIDAKEEMKERLKKYWDRINFIQEKAKKTKEWMPFFDFVYIDGNHSYEYVKQDIEIYWKKIKVGGVIGGDDFNNGSCEEHDGVTKAILEFVKKNNLKLYIGNREWWVVK